MILLEDTQDTKHIAVVTKGVEKLPLCSAIYTHYLRLHKKVSLVCYDKLDTKYSFLPWFDKVKEKIPSSVDLVVKVDFGVVELYDFFTRHNLGINKKMATAIYAALLIEYNNFTSKQTNGMVFAIAGEMMALGCDFENCSYFLNKRVALCKLRLKSLMLGNMYLQNGAKDACFCISDDMLKSSGADLDDAFDILKEAIGLDYVERILLFKSDEDNKILKLIDKENNFEKKQ